MKARDNPFRVEQLHRLRFRFQLSSMPELLNVISAAGFRGAIIGPHGSGKSTLIEELSLQLCQLHESPHLIRITEENASRQRDLIPEWLNHSDPEQILILDGAEQLTPALWKSLKQTSDAYRGLLITAHRPGLLPTLYQCRTNETLLAELVQELLADSTLLIEEQQLWKLYLTQRGNIRNCLRELYDQVGS